MRPRDSIFNIILLYTFRAHDYRRRRRRRRMKCLAFGAGAQVHTAAQLILPDGECPMRCGVCIVVVVVGVSLRRSLWRELVD